MKKIIVLLALGVLIAGTASAQEALKSDRKARSENRENREDRKLKRVRKSPEELAARQTEILNKTLDLSKKQQKKVTELSLKRIQETEALRSRYAASTSKDQGRGRNAGLHQEMKAIHDHWEAGLQDALSKKQYTQYEASHKEMKSRRLADRGERGDKADKRRASKRDQF
jgi:periplasmic protein CpxP/Spy